MLTKHTSSQCQLQTVLQIEKCPGSCVLSFQVPTEKECCGWGQRRTNDRLLFPKPLILAELFLLVLVIYNASSAGLPSLKAHCLGPLDQGTKENQWVVDPTGVTMETLRPSRLQLEFSLDASHSQTFPAH